MADKNIPVQRVPNATADKQDAISEDITRIVGYLNAKRTNSSERASGLMSEIAQRREENAMPPPEPRRELPRQVADRPQSVAEQPTASREMHKNPAISERYHSFCHDLDKLLESFKARIEGDKPVQH